MLADYSALSQTADAQHLAITPGETHAPFAPRAARYLAVKTAVEWLLAAVLLLLTAPLVLLLALAVRLTSRGPAFYAQTRLGRFGKPYRMYKLRTMVHNAEVGTGAVWAARNDARTTRLGGLLRRTHLDELPQLCNVLRGEMSLIGPRPERPEIVARVEPQIPGYCLRLLVRPGITGLAQMLVPADDPNDHRLLGLRRKLAHDVYYVREISWRLDARIALCTPCHFIAEAISALGRGLVRPHGEQIRLRLEPGATEDEQYLRTSLYCVAGDGARAQRQTA